MQPRLIENERTLIAARWIVLAAVLVLAHFAPQDSTGLMAVYALIAAGALYNLIYVAMLRRRSISPGVAEITVFAEVLFSLGCVAATGGQVSPLLPLFAWPVVSAAYRLGLAEALAAAAFGSIGLALIFLVTPLGLDMTLALPTALAAAGLFAVAMIMQMLFSQAFGSVERGLAREMEAAKEYTTKLTAVRAQAHAIAEVSSILSSTLNYQRVLETILTEFYKLLGYDIGIVFLYESGGVELRIAADRGLTGNERQARLTTGQGALAQVVQQGEPVILPNPGTDEELQKLGSLADMTSSLLVPLHAGFEMYGAVLIACRGNYPFIPTHLDLLLAFCNQAVLAMQNAQLYENLRRERDRVVEKDEEARRRVARDLHDGPVQLVAAMAMKSEIIKRLAAVNPALMGEELDSLAEMSHRASRDLRTVLFELRPVMLESHGLVATLKEYVQKMRESQSAPLRMDPGRFERRLPGKAESTIFTIIQEAVNNALKHAEAKSIWIRLAERDRTLVVIVEDDGVGFDMATVEGSYGSRGSLGLLNMRERAEMVDGMLTIRSMQGFGTTVTLRVPITDAPDPQTPTDAPGAR
jgi:signal transduction histidine kinase